MRRWTLVMAMAATACATAPAVPATAPQPTASASLPLALHWYRTSAEQRAIFLQTYRMAGDRLRELSRGVAAPWGVIMDADETLLDNSLYQLRQNSQGKGFDPASWEMWARERAATPLPGGVEFTRLVHSLGGRVVVVTNREQPVCDDTRANLAALGVAADAVLCKGPSSDKNPRFQAVEAGTAVAGLPALRVLMYLGDNIQDFPGQSQQVRGAEAAALDRFGSTFILLPNPLYGSWERNPGQ
jgi:5'-nucleotidase (lipoprotein e(P4) family)